ncbi:MULTISPECIES: hypothetical protein [Pseudomonas]|uniref:Uncharacterized protein n=1 Tax=Pseudomonas zeae TaxID=2745510 RepID=A0ABU5BRL1_9PSED|nr:hypothetical protein [Pseudomonas zeae]MDX9679323.1 hypothetical protein [Pseudomonas zeae]
MLNLKRDERLTVSEAEIYLVELYRKLTSDDQQRLLCLARSLAEHPEAKNPSPSTNNLY